MVAGLVGFIVALWFVTPVLSHGDEPRVEISSERITPGGVIEVRGVDFEREELVTLMLISGDTAIPFGEVTADLEGIFLQIVTVPVDLPEGRYNFLAITDDHNVTSPDLVVQGSPILDEGGGQGPRDEDDPLLAPMPTYPPGFVPGGVLQATVAPAAQEQPASNPSPTAFLLIAGLVGILVAFGMRWSWKR